jgi:hypothetical protein
MLPDRHRDFPLTRAAFGARPAKNDSQKFHDRFERYLIKTNKAEVNATPAAKRGTSGKKLASADAREGVRMIWRGEFLLDESDGGPSIFHSELEAAIA